MFEKDHYSYIKNLNDGKKLRQKKQGGLYYFKRDTFFKSVGELLEDIENLLKV